MEFDDQSSDVDLRFIINRYYRLFIIDVHPLIRPPLSEILNFEGLYGLPWTDESTPEKLIRLIASTSVSQKDLISAFTEVAKKCDYNTLALLMQNDIPIFEKYCIEFAEEFHKRYHPSDCEDLTYNMELMNRLRQDSLLSECDFEVIERERNNSGNTRALFLLFARVTARHPRWLPLFYTVLFDMKCFETIKYIDEDLYKELNEICDLPELESISREIREEVVKCITLHIESLSGRNEEVKERLLETDSGGVGTSSEYFEEDDTIQDVSLPELLSLRQYQMELVETALQGRNTIICAPTNSGKTYMATHIIMEHLKKNKEGKVVFLVHRVALVSQQAKVIERFLGTENFKVGRASGLIKESDDIVNLLRNVNVLVCTAGLLVNAFEEKRPEKKIESVTTFSLLLFDECHNCTGNHVYKQIMNRYVSAKSTQLASRLPQVVGITASFGTNKASVLPKAMEHITNIMNSLDCRHIDVVKRNVEELRSLLPDPVSGFIMTSDRHDNRFEQKLVDIMKLTECYLKKFQDGGYFKPNEDISELIRSIPTDHSSAVYTNFVGSLRYLHFRAKMEPREYRSDIVAIYEILNACNEAFKVNRLFRSKDATKHLTSSLQLNTDENKFSKIRKIIYGVMQTTGILSEQFWTPDNPVLDKVKEKLLDQFKNQPDSRVIVFVKERDYVTYLKDAFQEDKRFDSFGYDCIVGARNNKGKIKLTQTELTDVLENFKSGLFKILFATNVVEEGLDVPSCNLVIRYSHITNEISMQQSKGRARAKNSQYLVLVPRGQEWIKLKEEANIKRKQLEEDALHRITNMSDSELENLLDGRRQRGAERNRGARNYDNSRSYILKCRGCQKEICEHTDMKKYEVHHFMVNEEKLNNLFTKIHEEGNPSKRQLRGDAEVIGKIFCGESRCKRDLGNIMKVNQVAYPNFKLMSFSVFDTQRHSGNDRGLQIRQWRDSPFEVFPLAESDITERYSRIGNDWLTDRLMSD